LAAWKQARCCYKALPAGEEGTKKLAAEMPDSQLGVLLLMWLKQVRKVARKAAALRAAELQVDQVQEKTSKAQRALAEAEAAAAAKAEEEARKAAEEAAAAAAAAEQAAAEGEGGGEGGEEAAAAE
jgi:hypothetical protein